MLKCVKNEAEVVHDPNIKRVSTMRDVIILNIDQEYYIIGDAHT